MVMVTKAFEKSVEDFKFYLAQKECLLANPKYKGKYIVIKDKEILRAFKDEDAAIDYMDEKGVPMGQYVVQIVAENDGAFARFTSNVFV